MSFETLKDQLTPGAMIVTRKDRMSKLYREWNPDVLDPNGMYDPTYLDPRTVCTMIGNSQRLPHDWFYVMADGMSGWLSYWDIAHVEHINRAG